MDVSVLFEAETPCVALLCVVVFQYPSGGDGAALGGRHPEGRQLHQRRCPRHPRLKVGWLAK